ncbi:MAG: hypothetical protein A2068_06400 [Ignavibacteria bacterium GWB2_35_6b]|nr:MAG: hypothetical protein A2068_06400 [Ignavibacteria bacterium GWB2_35_6b]
MKNYLIKIFHFVFKTFFAVILMPRSNKKITKVLLSGYTGLGHFVLKSVIVKKIEELYPGSQVYIITGNSFGNEFVLDNYPTIILKQESRAINKIMFFLKLRKEKFDVVIMPIDAAPNFLIRGSILAGIPIRVGHVFNGEYLPEYYYTVKVPVKLGKVRSELDMNYDLIEALYKGNFDRRYEPFVNMNFNGIALEKFGLQKEKYICIQMGSANGMETTKRWLENNFKLLIEKLSDNFTGYKIIALGDKGDAIIVDRICNSINSDNLLNLSGKTTLSEVKSLIFNCKFLICHDSGLLHIGNALKKNVIAIYGPSDPDFYADNLPTCHIIREKIHCSPCQGLFPGKFSFLTEAESLKLCSVPECMQAVTVDSVYNKCVELLNGSQTNSSVLN